MIEQRKSRRYQIRLPLRIVRRGTAPFSAQGETCNLSSRGVLFASNCEIPVGERIEYVIQWPCADKREGPRDLYCLGSVLRVTADPEKATFLIAATLDRYAFTRLSE